LVVEQSWREIAAYTNEMHITSNQM